MDTVRTIIEKQQKRYDFLVRVCVVLSVLAAIELFLLINNDWLFKESDWTEIGKYVCLSIVPVGLLFIVNYYFITRNKEELSKYQSETVFQPVRKGIDGIYDELKTLNAGLQGLEKIMYSNEDLIWNELLENASSLDLCIFYVHDKWIEKHGEIFDKFCERGGILNIYLPHPLEISSRYIDRSIINKKTSDEIINTYIYFKKMMRNEESSIKTLDEGMNYMFAKIVYEDDSEKYYLSPYSNDSSKGNLPKFLFNGNMPGDLKTFFSKEYRFMTEKSKDFIDLEKEQYLIYKKERNTLFVSTGFVCDAGCKFCYGNSVVENPHRDNDPLYIARLICSFLEYDDRFKLDVNDGTTIMLGGFNDPFHESYIDSTIHILEGLKNMNVKSPVHIATRFPLTEEQLRKIPNMKNLVINYSISSFPENPGIAPVEYPNQKERFGTASKLISGGHNVALFIRPVIKDITIRDLNHIIKHIDDAKINVITVGGLYFDQNIKNSLEQSNVNFDLADVHDTKLVLDTRKTSDLKKTCLNDAKLIINALKSHNSNFKVFDNARDRVNHYKNMYHLRGNKGRRR